MVTFLPHIGQFQEIMKMEREKWLDTLKVIACIIVFLDHFYLTFCRNIVRLNKLLDIKPLGIIINGNFAVCLFLVISAYIICVQIYKNNDFERIQKIAFKRYFRLMLPIYYSGSYNLNGKINVASQFWEQHQLSIFIQVIITIVLFQVQYWLL